MYVHLTNFDDMEFVSSAVELMIGILGIIRIEKFTYRVCATFMCMFITIYCQCPELSA
jgi:hypothetical protein